VRWQGVRVESATHDVGTGAYTVMAMIAAYHGQPAMARGYSPAQIALKARSLAGLKGWRQ